MSRYADKPAPTAGIRVTAGKNATGSQYQRSKARPSRGERLVLSQAAESAADITDQSQFQ